MAGTDPYIIDWNQPCSIPWFRLYMRLPGRGLVPMVMPNDVMPSRDVVAHFFGPRSSQGYTFDHHGNQAYEDYVRDLFTRVLQLKWPSTSVIPFHFARALVAEACDIEVNWAEFAFKQTHPRRNPPDTPRLLSVFSDLTDPLPPLRKVIPVSDIKVCFPFFLTFFLIDFMLHEVSSCNCSLFTIMYRNIHLCVFFSSSYRPMVCVIPAMPQCSRMLCNDSYSSCLTFN